MIETIPRYPAVKSADQPRQVRIVRFACLAVIVILAVGLWAEMPYLIVEHRRLEPWKIFELWCADILALFWFARFAIVHAIQGEPLVGLPLEEGRKQLRVVTIAGAAAVLLDLIFTFSLMYDERERYSQADVTEAQILAIHEVKRPAETWYEVDCRFQLAAGAFQDAHLRVEANKHQFSPTLPFETAQVLRSQGQAGNQIRIRYDRQFPARAWADGAGWDDGQKIYWFSLLTLLFQAILTGVFLLQLRKHSAGGFLPWWWDIYKALPLFVAAFWMCAMGLIDRLLD